MKNRKGIILTASILGTIAIASTGFAAWVITSSATKEQTGNIEVDTVTDKRHVITFADAEPKADGVHFRGKPSGESWDNAGKWLTYDGEATEDLTDSWVVNVTHYSNETLTTSLALNDAAGWTVDTNLKQIKKGGDVYLTYEFSVLDKDTLKENGDGEEAKKGTLTLTFHWGAKFGNQNPLKYYNTTYTSAADDNGLEETTAGDVAYEALNALKELNGKTFTVTVSIDA